LIAQAVFFGQKIVAIVVASKSGTEQKVSLRAMVNADIDFFLSVRALFGLKLQFQQYF
jgi:hypothetical protein